MMKRTLVILLCACLFVSMACTKKQETPEPAPTAPVTAPPATADASTPVTPTPPVTVHARAYGEEYVLVADENGLTARIAYPQGDVLPVNEKIYARAELALYNCRTQAAAAKPDANGMRASASADYDAYVYADRFVGVKGTGEYRETVSGNRRDILYAVNYDLDAGKALTLTDVVASDKVDTVRAALADRLRWLDATALNDAGALDTADMQTFVIRSDGVEWLFIGARGVVGVLLDYDTLAPCIRLNDPAVTPTPTPAPAAAETSDPEASKEPVIEETAVCLFDGVHIRSMPSTTEGEILATVNANAQLDVIDADVTKGWHEILYDGQIAFVYASLVELSGEGRTYTTGWVQASYLHVRAAASTDSPLLGTMQYQERVRVADPNPVDGWYKIWYEGKLAYAYASGVFLGTYPTNTPASADDVQPADAANLITADPYITNERNIPITAVGVCTADGVLVRSEPNARASVYGSLKKDEQVFIVLRDSAPGWDRIFVYTQGSKGYTGYVQSRYVLAG